MNAASDSDGLVTTVTGPIAAGMLGPTLIHEHLCCDLSRFSGKTDNMLTDTELIAAEMRFFIAAGGRSIVEVTPDGIGRNPSALRKISESSGVQIVSGIAFYDEATYPDWLRRAKIGEIADYILRQIEDGQDGVRAGLIGELMSHNEPAPNPSGYRLHELEQRVFKAAALVQKRTGLAITTHASLGRAGHAQLDALEAGGANLGKVAIGHCDAHWHVDAQNDLNYYLPILRRGAFCQFDLIGWSELAPDDIRADRIAALVGLGYERQILLATDTCRSSQLYANGGRSYDFLWQSFLPRLRDRGISDRQIHSMLVETPRRLLART